MMAPSKGRTRMSSSTGSKIARRTASASVAIFAPILPGSYVVAIAVSDYFAGLVALGQTTKSA